MPKKPSKPSGSSEYSPEHRHNVLLEEIRSELKQLNEGHAGLQEKVDVISKRLEQLEPLKDEVAAIKFFLKNDVATKKDLEEVKSAMATKKDLEEVKAVIPTLATKKDLEEVRSAMATKKDLEEVKAVIPTLATKKDLEEVKAVIPTLATKKDLERFATKEEIKALANALDKRLTAVESR